MKIFAIVGRSNSGKTFLIRRLIPKLKERNKRVVVVKHCHHGFELEPEGKDSWEYVLAGSEAVAMISPDRLAILKKNNTKKNFLDIIFEFFKNADIVLVEGGKKEKELKKIEVLRPGVSEEVESDMDELIAVVSDKEIKVDKPTFKSEQIDEITAFLEGYDLDYSL